MPMENKVQLDRDPAHKIPVAALFESGKFVLPEILRNSPDKMGSIRFRMIMGDGMTEYKDPAFSAGSLFLGFRETKQFDRENDTQYVAYVLDQRGGLCFQLSCKKARRHEEPGFYDWLQEEGIGCIEFIRGSEQWRPYSVEYVTNEVRNAPIESSGEGKWTAREMLERRAWVKDPFLRDKVITALQQKYSFDVVAKIIRAHMTNNDKEEKISGTSLAALAERILGKKKGSVEEKKRALADALALFDGEDA